MKKLDTLNYNDLSSGCNFAYKNFSGYYKNGYVTLYYDNDYINTFMTYSNNIGKIKNEIKTEIKKHDIKELLNFSIDFLKNNFSDSDIEKIYSYVNLQNDKNNEHKKINKYLINEIKEYFIYRLVRK